MVQVMVILADGFEEGEAITILDVLRRAGFKADSVSINGREVVTGTHHMRLFADKVMGESLEEFQNYDMIVLPGGWDAADHMAADVRLTSLLRWYDAQPCSRYRASLCLCSGRRTGRGQRFHQRSFSLQCRLIFAKGCSIMEYTAAIQPMVMDKTCCLTPSTLFF